MLSKIFSFYRNIPGIVLLFVIMFPFMANVFVSNTIMLDNRVLNEKPKKISRNFAKEYEAYYNDTFAFRKKLVSKYMKLQKMLKFDGGKFLYGLDGWMFYDSSKDREYSTIVDYLGEKKFDHKLIEDIVEGLNKARNFYEERGVRFLVYVAPNKHGIYSEYMPKNLQGSRKSGVSRMEDAVDYINKNTGIKIINGKKSIMDAKKKTPYLLYYMRDTHWNMVGAYVGYNDILAGLGLKTVPIGTISEKVKTNTDMGYKNQETFYDVEYLPDTKVEKIFENDDLGIQEYIFTSSKPLYNKTILVIKDSFADALIPYISKGFAKSIFLHHDGDNYRKLDEYIKKHKPDYVVDEIVERNILYYSGYVKYYN